MYLQHFQTFVTENCFYHGFMVLIDITGSSSSSATMSVLSVGSRVSRSVALCLTLAR